MVLSNSLRAAPWGWENGDDGTRNARTGGMFVGNSLGRYGRYRHQPYHFGYRAGP